MKLFQGPVVSASGVSVVTEQYVYVDCKFAAGVPIDLSLVDNTGFPWEIYVGGFVKFVNTSRSYIPEYKMIIGRVFQIEHLQSTLRESIFDISGGKSDKDPKSMLFSVRLAIRFGGVTFRLVDGNIIYERIVKPCFRPPMFGDNIQLLELVSMGLDDDVEVTQFKNHETWFRPF